MPWYVYGMWVYRQERRYQDDIELEPYLDIPFEPDYKHGQGYVQRLSLVLRVPQPEGMSMPTAQQDPNTNAMYKSLLFRSFHAHPMDKETGKTEDAFECLHSNKTVDGEKNPFETFAHQWKQHYESYIVPNAAEARRKLHARACWPSLWETREVYEEMVYKRNLRRPEAHEGRWTPSEEERAEARSAAAACPFVNWQEDCPDTKEWSAPRLTMVEYACLIVHGSADYYEGIARARVAPKQRRDELAKDSVEDPNIERMQDESGDFGYGDAGEHDGEDYSYLAEDGSTPLKPVLELRKVDWEKACFYQRDKTSAFVKYMITLGLLREFNTVQKLTRVTQPKAWRQAWREEIGRGMEMTKHLPDTATDKQFASKVVEQYAAFKERNIQTKAEVVPDTKSPSDASAPAATERADGQAGWVPIDNPARKMQQLIAELEREPKPGEKKKKITLTHLQVLACAQFSSMMQVAWDEEKQGIPWDKRSQKTMVLLGQGGTGKSMIVQKLFVPLVEWAFPADDDGTRWAVLAYSHAQANAISTSTFRAKTLHNVSGMRVQSLANKDMAPGQKKDFLLKTWSNKMALFLEEISMDPAEVINMVMYRSMWGRKEKWGVGPTNYGWKGHLFGRMPVVVLLGDFLQLKPPKAISLIDDLHEKAREGKRVSIEAQTACDAFHSIEDVIELVETRRFKDKILPNLMNWIRTADGKKMPDVHWKHLLSRDLENASVRQDLQEERFAKGHVVGIFWENIARSMVERSVRDAQELDVPLYFSQACDKLPGSGSAFKSSDQEQQRINREILLEVNVHNTGHLHGILPVHVGMKMRLLTKLSAADGLVNERLCTVVKIVPHEDEFDQDRPVPTHFTRVQLKYMLRGIWASFDDLEDAPLAKDMLAYVNCADQGDEKATEEAKDFAGGLVYVQLEQAHFTMKEGSYRGLAVTRWQFPLTHAMVRTAMSSQGLTFPDGVVADLRRQGGMTDDIWWLNVYVMLSRATSLSNLLLVGLTNKVKELLEAGPPEYVKKKIQTLQRKAASTQKRAEEKAKELNFTLP